MRTMLSSSLSFFFFFNDTATTEIYTLSLHDALPILVEGTARSTHTAGADLPQGHDWYDLNSNVDVDPQYQSLLGTDRKSTRLNSSHLVISYAVFCLKKKKKNKINNASTELK